MKCILEGLPGAGKTSLLRRLETSTKLGTVEVLPEYLSHVSGDREDISFYILNEAEKSVVMQNSTADALFCDRYWHSSVVYNAASCNGTQINELQNLYRMLHKDATLFSEYVYIYLRVPIEVSLTRAQTPDVANMWSTPSFAERTLAAYDLIFENLETINPNLQGKLRIDMHQSTIEEALVQIEDLLLEMRGR